MADEQTAGPEYNCQECGACCVGYDVYLNDRDLDVFEAAPHLLRLTVLYPRTAAPPLRFLARDPQTDRCKALAGPLENCHCTIYAQRPYLCRALQPGSEHCREARARLARVQRGED